MIRRKFITTAFLVFAVFLGLPPSSSQADSLDPAAEADVRIAHGLALRRERHDAEALAEFRRAYALHASPRALAQIALASSAVGLWVEAEQTFEDVLDQRDDPWVEKRRAQLEDELRELRMHLADLELDVVPANAEVWINGARAARKSATGAFRVVSGRMLVEVRSDGFEPQRRVFEVTPGSRVHDAVTLAALEVPAERVGGAPSPGSRPRESSDVPPPREARGIDVHRVLLISSIAAAGSAFAIGTLGAIRRQSAVDAYNDNSRCNYGSLTRNVRCAGVAADVDRYTTVMASGYAASGLLAIAGAILTLTAPHAVRIDVSRQGRDGAMLSVAHDF